MSNYLIGEFEKMIGGNLDREDVKYMCLMLSGLGM